jgi:hypothetical protein
MAFLLGGPFLFLPGFLWPFFHLRSLYTFILSNFLSFFFGIGKCISWLIGFCLDGFFLDSFYTPFSLFSSLARLFL